MLTMPKGYHPPDAQKTEQPEFGWCSVFSLILILVTGAGSLSLALIRFESESHAQDSAQKVIDLASNISSKIVWDTPQLTERSGLMPLDVAQAAPGFFIEIGTSSSSVRRSIRAILLERKGWNGVCVVPFPGDFSTRNCSVVATAVGGTGGKTVMAEDCSQQHPPHTITGLIETFNQESKCPSAEAHTVSMVDLLSLSSAPPVIDYISLESNGTEFDILDNFPFGEFCSRSWSIKHAYDAEVMEKMKHIFEINHGCRVREAAGEYWARCSCEKDLVKVPQSQSRVSDSMATQSDGHIVRRNQK